MRTVNPLEGRTQRLNMRMGKDVIEMGKENGKGEKGG